MKLLTEISPRGDGRPGCWLAYGDGDLEHDAAAAHALVQAINTLAERGPFVAATDWIYGRADELMRQWGYEE